MGKKIEYNEGKITVENTEIETPRTFSQSDLIREMKADNIMVTPYIKQQEPVQKEVGRFDNWKFFVASRINILQFIQVLSSVLALSMEAPAIKAIIPANFFPYVIGTTAFLTILERTLTKDHKNLI